MIEVYHDMIEAAIQLHWNRLNLTEIRQQKLVMGNVVFLREFGTISLNLGRAAGHTTYIENNAMPNDLIIVLNHAWTKEFHRGRIHTMNQLLNNYLKGMHSVEKVWVDTASVTLKKPSDMYQFYQEVSALKPSQIIMLG